MVPKVWILTVCIASICMFILPVCNANFAQGIVPLKCIKCLCEIETRCSPKPCSTGDGPKTCGYFGITEDYYNACGKPGNGWKECANDKFCSSLCIQNYIVIHMENCNEKNCLSFARLHHGGPHGCQNPNTMTYGLWVQKCASSK